MDLMVFDGGYVLTREDKCVHYLFLLLMSRKGRIKAANYYYTNVYIFLQITVNLGLQNKNHFRAILWTMGPAKLI